MFFTVCDSWSVILSFLCAFSLKIIHKTFEIKLRIYQKKICNMQVVILELFLLKYFSRIFLKNFKIMQKYNHCELLLGCYYFVLKYSSRTLIKSFKTIDFWQILGAINLSKSTVTVNIASILHENPFFKLESKQ